MFGVGAVRGGKLTTVILFRLYVGALLCMGISACGGGGGGEGGGNNTGRPDGSRRTTGTGIRIIHAALDVEPVDLKIGANYLNSARFMEPSFYAEVDSGLQNVILERHNSPGVNIYSSPINLAKKTEYSLLLTGQVTRNNFLVSLIEEPVAQPESGSGRVQLVSALEGSSQLTLNGAGITLGPVPFRLSSGYADVPAGPQTMTVTNSRGGVIASLTLDIPDRGEATIVVGGSSSQGVTITRIFNDLD